MPAVNRVDAHLDQIESFADLGLPVGTHFIIETAGASRKYQVQLIGYWDKRSILISPPLRDGKEVLLEKDAVLAVRLLEGKNVCAFESRVLYRSSHPYTYYHLQFPDEIDSRQIRNSERLDIQLPVLVDSDFDILGDWPKSATLTDLSKTGARLIAPYHLGEKTHELVLIFDLTVSAIRKTLRIPCLIRNIELSAAHGDDVKGHYVIGAQFVNMTEEQILTLSSFIYEHQR
jgi:c-di-GMP-binding flagellar brake protein YcgR